MENQGNQMIAASVAKEDVIFDLNKKEESRFVIKLEPRGYDYAYYSKHGFFEGAENCVSYTTKGCARRFLTKQAASDFIRDDLPSWLEKEQISIEELSDFEYFQALFSQKQVVSQ